VSVTTNPAPGSPPPAPGAPGGLGARLRSRRTLIILASISIGWKVLVFTLGAALPRWLVSDGVEELPPQWRAYGDSARVTAIALWNGPVERRGLIRSVRVMSVENVSSPDLPPGCDGRSARVRAYTYFAIPYSEVRTLCDRGVVEYRVLRRRPRRDG
jgi:hypothetical protein